MSGFSFPIEAFKSYNEGIHMLENIFKVMTITHKSCLLFTAFLQLPQLTHSTLLTQYLLKEVNFS